jgi:cellulose synthase/poly-beta-1,6-N-acetylglucosamine synthase-like glycosyltransferase/peptidoglycan/xylan/chitin deacetylase (PgdA/CDA1 family)/spore germination protein YaaH
LLSGDHHRPIFYDPRGRRAYIVAAINWAGFTLLGILLTCLVATSIWGPTLPALELSGAPRLLSSTGTPPPPSTGEPLIDPRNARVPADAVGEASARYGYFVNWDDNSFSSLKRNAHALDVLIVEWLHLSGSIGSLRRSDPGKEALVRTWVTANAPQLKLFPLVNNYKTDEKRWDGAGTANMLASRTARATFIDEVYQYVVGGGFSGLVLNFEELPPVAHADYVTLVAELSALLRTFSLPLLVAVPAADANYDYVKLAASADALIVAAYDEHFESGDPGPLAGQGWFEATLRERFKSVDPNKLIVAIGCYGYDWAGPGTGKEISVQEAWELLEQSGATFRFDRASLNPTFAYTDDVEHKQHHVWYLDGVTAFNQVGAALAMRPAGLALWRLGTEDPSAWAAFARGRESDAVALKAIGELRSGYDVLYKGKGEALTLSGMPEPGVRQVSIDARHNLITDQSIVVFPKSTTVSRWGARTDKAIALTFDDGPDRKYTPRILDILRDKGVRATFFVIGSAAAIHGDLLRRTYREGHDIGNHTFTHINSAEASAERLNIELNATQRLLEATLGVHTKLFRPPYARDIEPQTVDGTEALRLAASLGYITIGMTIDPKDWFRPIAEQIVDKTVEGAIIGLGNVVLLHDSGGVREATVLALPQIIDKLHAEGFRFVTIHELLQLPRAAVMPQVAPEHNWAIASNHTGFILYSGFNTVVTLLFYLGLSLGTVRLLWVSSFALWHARRAKHRPDRPWAPRSLVVIIPAYNEEKVICASIQTLLASRLKKFKIIVVDDGSADRTVELVRHTFRGTSRVSVLTKRNEGKWSALNYGLAHTDAQIVVTLDADTLFERDALPLLVQHFADPTVAAVAGGASVGNPVNLMTRLQALEYVTNQNLDRRALELVNGITVVPGSIGAWRREALLSIGGFHADTLAEDADATIRLERAGWQVVYEPRAIARTEAPETVTAFLKQRVRWMFGTLQVAYKNRTAMWRARPVGVGLFGLPNIIVFQFFFTLIAPVIDILLLWCLFSGVREYAMRPHEGIPPNLLTVGGYWALFQVLEISAAVLAMSIDRKRGLWRLLPLLLVQRFCYRQLLYLCAIRVAFAALKGRWLGWNKLTRTGRVAITPVQARA